MDDDFDNVMVHLWYIYGTSDRRQLHQGSGLDPGFRSKAKTFKGYLGEVSLSTNSLSRRTCSVDQYGSSIPIKTPLTKERSPGAYIFATSNPASSANALTPFGV
mmetsp:Transcript_26019/g.54024  ORF Transcript_26019/g.54024 Transcript_26019/m.54024 type:complete len:104 (-) Transcript_26019:974-1285(-)